MIQGIKDLVCKFFAKKETAIPAVSWDETLVSCSFPDGTVQNMAWNKLRAVIIETNDKGPWFEDVYFLLFSDEEKHYCSIPQCANGSQKLLEKLCQLPGFDNNAVIEAMGCTSNSSFLCWEQIGWAGENWPGIVEARNYKK